MKITWYECCMWIRKYRNFRLTLNQRCEWAFERMPSISISRGHRDEYIDLLVRLDLINIGHYIQFVIRFVFSPAYNYRLFDATASSPHDDLFMIACWFECAAGSARLFIIMCDMHLESVVFFFALFHTLFFAFGYKLYSLTFYQITIESRYFELSSYFVVFFLLSMPRLASNRQARRLLFIFYFFFSNRC